MGKQACHVGFSWKRGKEEEETGLLPFRKSQNHSK